MNTTLPRRFTGDTLVVATHNKGKLREIEILLKPYASRVMAAGDLGLPEPEETGSTYVENAILKACAAAEASGHPALADDSGLDVTALGSKPGIHSARWAGPGKDFRVAMERVNTELGSSNDRSARFVCCLALAWPDGHVETFEGRIEGALIWPPRGDKGFGYDPMFIPTGDTRTYAEIAPEEKHADSHRTRAFRQLVERCFA